MKRMILLTLLTGVVLFVVSHFFGTLHAAVFSVFHVDISASYHCFYSPAAPQCPVISVREASSVEVSAINEVLHGGQERDLSDVEVPVVSVHSKEMSFKFPAEPITYLRTSHIQI